MGVILIIFRAVLFVVCTALCASTALLGGMILGHQFALRLQQIWSSGMLKVFGVNVILHGDKPEVGLLMSNHQSYIDIWIIPKYAISVFVAKLEVKKMPLMGWAASSVNTIYVDRSSKESRAKTKADISNRLKNGRSVIIFPEGTTGEGDGLLPLKPGMFYTAAEEGFPIIPVAIFYENSDLAWVGDDSMGAHFYRNFSKLSTNAHVVFGKPMVGNGDGEELMERVKNWKLENLQMLKETYRPELVRSTT
ncbi:lysophospholipid acyltransferase family protein [Bacteroidota bacterium]